MENNWSPPSFKWTMRRISLNVTARWMRGSASLWSPFALWHFSQVFANVLPHPDLCPSAVGDMSRVGVTEEGRDEKSGIQEMIQDGREQGGGYRMCCSTMKMLRSADRTSLRCLFHLAQVSISPLLVSPFSSQYQGKQDSTYSAIYIYISKYEENGCFPCTFRFL